jgi:ATP-dependent RNA helicase DDX35
MDDDPAGFVSSLYKPPSLLPIARHRQGLLYAIEEHPVTIVVGQTGSGKTTQIPQFLFAAGWCADGRAIAVTQVRVHFSIIPSNKIAAESCRHHGRYSRR